MSKLIQPKNYHALLDMHKTEQGIKLIKDFFQQNLSTELRLRRVTAPLFVMQGLGINDDLNGIERPVTFPIKDLGDRKAEVVHSLAKWKRLTLADYKIPVGHGIYTDMNSLTISTHSTSTNGTGKPLLVLKTARWLSCAMSSNASMPLFAAQSI